MKSDPGPWPLREMQKFRNPAGELEFPTHYFLVMELGGATDTRATAAGRGPPTGDLDDTGPMMPPPVAKQLFVFPVAKTNRNREGSVLVGRDGVCDVIIDDESVSRTHASLRLGGHVDIVDLHSRNGTTVDGIAAPREGQKPVGISVGQAISFGDVNATFLDAARLKRLIETMGE